MPVIACGVSVYGRRPFALLLRMRYLKIRKEGETDSLPSLPRLATQRLVTVSRISCRDATNSSKTRLKSISPEVNSLKGPARKSRSFCFCASISPHDWLFGHRPAGTEIKKPAFRGPFYGMITCGKYIYSTVTLFARFLGWSTSVPFSTAT